MEMKEEEIVKYDVEEGILICLYRERLDIDIDAAKKIVEARHNYIGENSYPTLLDATGLKGISREAREFMSTDDSYKGVKAGALLSGSIFTSYIGNFFLKITSNKQKVPVRLFTDRRKAMKWLKQFI